jgi:hypothetical protein
LWLQQIPVTLASLIEMVTSKASEPVGAEVQQLTAIANGTTKLKHALSGAVQLIS